MSSTFFPNNTRLIGIAEQVDADTPRAAPSYFLKVKKVTPTEPRVLAPLEESDASAQQGSKRVTGITPGCSIDLYGRPSEMDLIMRSVLWSGTATATAHSSTSTAEQVPVWWTIWDIIPDLRTHRYDGCVGAGVTLSSEANPGDNFHLQVSGWEFIALGFLAGVAEPTIAGLNEEVPWEYSELAISYDSVHPGRTSAYTININRNAQRLPGDAGFRSIAVAPGKLQVDGSVTRWLADEDTERAVYTGSPTGTVLTIDVDTEPLEILYDRPSESQSLLIASEGVAYGPYETADGTDGQTRAEVVGFSTDEQADITDNISVVAVG